MPTVDEIIAEWPQTARESAQTVLSKYGPPDETTRNMLAWHPEGRSDLCVEGFVFDLPTGDTGDANRSVMDD